MKHDIRNCKDQDCENKECLAYWEIRNKIGRDWSISSKSRKQKGVKE